jgi:hypothetical protein
MKPIVVLGMAQPYPGHDCEQVTIVASRIPDTIVAFGQTRHNIINQHFETLSKDLNDYDNGEWSSRFFPLSWIKKSRTRRFGNLICFRPQVKGGRRLLYWAHYRVLTSITGPHVTSIITVTRISELGTKQ